MPLDNRTDRKEMEIEEPIDNVLKCVSATGDFHAYDQTHWESFSTLSKLANLSDPDSPCKYSSF